MQLWQSTFIASARFVGVTVDGSPVTSTTSIATATVEQSLQLAKATAAFVESTTSPATRLIENASLKIDDPSFVLIAIAVLSPPPSASAGGAPKPIPKRATTRIRRRRRLMGLSPSGACQSASD